MQSHEFNFDDLPGVTFTVTRGVAPDEPAPAMGLPLPPEWLTIEARTEAGDIVMSGGMLGPEPLQED